MVDLESQDIYIYMSWRWRCFRGSRNHSGFTWHNCSRHWFAGGFRIRNHFCKITIDAKVISRWCFLSGHTPWWSPKGSQCFGSFPAQITQSLCQFTGWDKHWNMLQGSSRWIANPLLRTDLPQRLAYLETKHAAPDSHAHVDIWWPWMNLFVQLPMHTWFSVTVLAIHQWIYLEH